MVEDHSFCIDNYKDLTVDWARTPDGHYYSNKAPGPMLLAFPLFLAFDKVLNHDVQERSVRDKNRRDYNWLVFNTLSLLFQALPYLVLVAIALKWAATLGVSPAGLHVSCVSMLFGNTAALFMNTYFGHAIAANCVLALCLCLIYRRYAPSGLAYGLALLADYGSAVLLPGFLLATFVREPITKWKSCASRIAIGAFVPAVLWISYHVLCFGGPFTLPSRYQNPVFVDKVNCDIIGIFNLMPDPIVAFKLLFGFRRGMLWSQPWVLVILAGLILHPLKLKLFSFATSSSSQSLLLFAIPGFLLLLWMNAAFHEWHGGCTPGPRYMCAIFPVYGLLCGMLYNNCSKIWHLCIITTLLLSVVYWICIYSTNHMVPDISLWSHPVNILANDPSSNVIMRVIVIIILVELNGITAWHSIQKHNLRAT